MTRAHNWGCANCKHVARLEHAHHEPLAGCKLWWLCWGHWNATALPSTHTLFSFHGWLFNSSLCLLFSASLHSATLAGEASLVCRCCWSRWVCAQQLANPLKLLGCKFWVHLPFCLLQPPGLRAFFVVCGVWGFFIGQQSAIQNSAGQTWLSRDCTAVLQVIKRGTKPSCWTSNFCEAHRLCLKLWR